MMNESGIFDEDLERLWDLQDSWWIASFVFLILHLFYVTSVRLSPEFWDPRFNAFLQSGTLGCFCVFRYYATRIAYVREESLKLQFTHLTKVPGTDNFERINDALKIRQRIWTQA